MMFSNCLHINSLLSQGVRSENFSEGVVQNCTNVSRENPHEAQPIVQKQKNRVPKNLWTNGGVL